LINDNFGEEREREGGRNQSTYLPFLDYMKAYDEFDREKNVKTCGVFGEL
jgi:hypothetical protein